MAFAILLWSFTAVAQQPLPENIVNKIKSEAFDKSQVDAFAFLLTDYTGSRLVGSKLAERAEILVKDKLIELGFSNVRIERANDFPRGGWDNLKTYAAMTAPYYSNFTAVPKSWSGSTNGLVSGEVISLNVSTQEELEAFKGKLNNKIVLMPPDFKYQMNFNRFTDEDLKQYTVLTGTVPSHHFVSQCSNTSVTRTSPVTISTQSIMTLLAEEKPAVIISDGKIFNVLPAGPPSSANYRYGNPEPIAELILPIEYHSRMARLIDNKVPVSMEVEIKNEFYNNQVVNNVIAEIPGIDPVLKDEVVMIGAHLDSWFGGTGASDNAAGCAVMIEALRIIKETGIKPRRTIRPALWGGEEQMGLGSFGYRDSFLYDVAENKPRKGYEQFALYLNMDNGSGKFRGIFLEENEKAFPYFAQWNKALGTLGLKILSPRKDAEGGSDYVPFDQIGLPAFQFIQDPLEYARHMHTVMDTYERLIIDDLKYNAAVVACLALSAAMDNGKIPPKPQ
ncbi:aminopeptidase [Bacteroidia bacterium]|nr:aminopeptidase [Bacteroidia bacterium]